MDTAELSKQLVRAVRGRRTQATFSRRIGCQSNVLYTWEAGRRFPTARRFFEVAARAGRRGAGHARVPSHAARLARHGIPDSRRRHRALNVDLAADPDAVRRLKAWAAAIGLGRIERGDEGLYSYNLFCVSEHDYAELQRLHRAYFRQLRALVAESAPSERVVMANLQLFSLSR